MSIENTWKNTVNGIGVIVTELFIAGSTFVPYLADVPYEQYIPQVIQNNYLGVGTGAAVAALALWVVIDNRINRTRRAPASPPPNLSANTSQNEIYDPAYLKQTNLTGYTGKK